MRMAVTLYFIRHGETQWNAEARYQGQADVPMNDTGRAQAQRNGEALRPFLPELAQADFLSSPMARARETMEIVRTALDLPAGDFRIDDRLMEAHYGFWQGTLASDLPKVDAEGLAARMRDPYRWRPKGGESYEDLMARTRSWLEGIERNTVVVSHGGVSRTLRGHVLGLDVATVPLLEMPQDRVLILRHGTSEWF